MKKLIAVFLALLLLSGVAVSVSAQSGGAGFYDFETSVRMWQNLRVLGTTTLNGGVETSGSFTVGNDLTVTDDMTVTDVLKTGFFAMTPASTIVLNFNDYLTPTTSYQPISSTQAIGTASIAIKPAGTLLRIANVGSQTITFTDTGTLVLSGNSALGANDVALLISDGTSWIQVGESDN